MHIQCLKSDNPNILAGKAYPVEWSSTLYWRFHDEDGSLRRAPKDGSTHAGASRWRVCCNPNVESGSEINQRLELPHYGQRLAVQCLHIPGPPYEAKFLGTFDAGGLPGIRVRDSEGYEIHIWPGTATWEVL